MKKQLLASLAATGLMFGLAGSASAYTGDPINTGKGFVGKGEVQTPWGWNNATLQKNAKDVSFTVEAEDRYEYDCVWTTGEGTKGQKTHNVTQKRSTSVDKAVVYEVRNNPKSAVTGFNLLDFGRITISGDPVPSVGDACLGGGTGGTVAAVRDVADTSPASLLAHYGALPSITLVDTNAVL